MKNCSLWEGLNAGAGEEHEEEGVAEIKCYELTTKPISHPLCTVWREEIEKSGTNLSLGRREEWREGIVLNLFLFLTILL